MFFSFFLVASGSLVCTFIGNIMTVALKNKMAFVYSPENLQTQEK